MILKHSNLFDILDFVMKMGQNETFLKNAAKMVDNLAQSDEGPQRLGSQAGCMIEVFLKYCL